MLAAYSLVFSEIDVVVSKTLISPELEPLRILHTAPASYDLGHFLAHVVLYNYALFALLALRRLFFYKRALARLVVLSSLCDFIIFLHPFIS